MTEKLAVDGVDTSCHEPSQASFGHGAVGPVGGKPVGGNAQCAALAMCCKPWDREGRFGTFSLIIRCRKVKAWGPY